MSADWTAYRKCPTCQVDTGTPCKSVSSKLIDGHPDRHECTLAEPHLSRPLRSAARHSGWEALGSNCLACRIAAEVRRRAAVTSG